MKFQKPRGTIDLIGKEFKKYKYVSDTILGVLEEYGFGQIRTPMFENLELLAKDAGEEVLSQIYAFEDRAGRRLGLKSDITPAIARVVGNQGRSIPNPIKFACYDRVYRYERPQKGRLREISQINAEMFGTKNGADDAMLLQCFYDCYSALNIDVEILVGFRPILDKLTEILVGEEKKSELIRLIDKKDKIPENEFEEKLNGIGINGDKLNRLKPLLNFDFQDYDFEKKLKEILNEEVFEKDIEQFTRIIKLINNLKISKNFKFDLSLARGSEYYTGMIFEARPLESMTFEKTSIGGGGRYDNLVQFYSGYDIDAIGFSIGVDRVVLLLDELKQAKK